MKTIYLHACLFSMLGLAVGLNSALAHPAVSPQHFSVPAGNAEQTLAQFTAQSSQPAVFLTEMLHGVRTQAIDGEFTPLEALTRMVAGTPLQPAYDPRTAALALKAPRHRTDGVVELPPYVVEENSVRPWRYASVAGLEVLSRCSDEVTRQWIDRQHRLHELLKLILPAQFQGKSDVPANYVLFSDDLQPEATREMVGAIREQEARRLGEAGGPPLDKGERAAEAEDLEVRFLPNFRFWDQDSLAIFFVMDETKYDRTGITLTPGYVRYVMESRTPPLPPWFVEGLLTLYDTIRLPVPPVMPPLARPTMSESAYDFKFHPDKYDAASFKPFVWISPQETELMIRTFGTLAKHSVNPTLAADFNFLPLATLFTTPPGQWDEAHQKLWRYESALFVSWALSPVRYELPAPDGTMEYFDAKYIGPQALWKFLARSSDSPVSEAQFKECFGLDFAAAEARLLQYLPQIAGKQQTTVGGVKVGFQLSPPHPIESLSFELRDAAPAEVSRIKGRLDRLEIAYVRELYAEYPQLAPKYVAQARRTLQRAYAKGERDPRLLVELGLCECDAGSDATAVPFLEAAVQAKIVRPRAYYELARITYEKIRAAAPDNRLNTAEAGEVLQPLITALRQSPALAEIYELIAEVWLHSEGRLSSAQLAVLDNGIRRFPRRLNLIYAAALLNSLNGQTEAAIRLAGQGSEAALDPDHKHRFRALQAALTAPVP